MKISKKSQDVARLEYTKRNDEISQKHLDMVTHHIKTMQRGGALEGAIEREFIQMAEAKVQARMEIYLSAFRHDGVTPDESDINEICSEIESTVKAISNRTHHPPHPSSREYYSNIVITARRDLTLARMKMQREQSGSEARRSHADQPVPKNLDRQCMELAITEAKKSRAEDGRIHPKVGAVVVKEGRILATAYRGETGLGHHAEFGALEKKLGHEVVSGATLYTTLEPCTTRRHPKVPCARRLLERGIRRVVIGMLDPNPIICGKGIRILRSAKVATDLFPHDLMEIIEEINREFVRTQENAEAPQVASQPSPVDPWLKLRGQWISLEPLYDETGQPAPYPRFRVEEVTDSDVKLKKESSDQMVFLPLACLSNPWRADSYGAMSATIDKGRLYFDSTTQMWVYRA
jgi:pyrimidine deaminase RibD-like protein